MLNTTLDINNTEWKRINMRRVEHLPAVELIHDLYSQYAFRINNIRFRNTITTWKDGVVNSYAPVSEWEQLEEILGNRFYDLDKLLIQGLEKLYTQERTFAEDYLKSISINSLKKLSNKELGTTINNIQNFTLGDLYRLNFVQVEHGLTSAIYKILDENNLSHNILSRIIISDIPTEFQSEEIAFTKLVNKYKESQNIDIDNLLKEHFNTYAYMHSAYGEVPYSLKYYISKFKKFFKDSDEIADIKRSIRKNRKSAVSLLKEIGSKKLNTLVPLMISGGKFRDNNKARLGKTMFYKFAVLDEIARRTNIKRGDIGFYSMLELNNLLAKKERIKDSLIIERKKYGVVLMRTESIKSINSPNLIKAEEIINKIKDQNIQVIKKDNKRTLIGVCASVGKISGKAKIVQSYKDGHKITPGDIMIAIGTDFDLMDAIQRSGAVITEEGGLLSHASVVCRELEKPCCIGVLDATSIIQDGDFIELNAEKGEINVTKHE